VRKITPYCPTFDLIFFWASAASSSLTLQCKVSLFLIEWKFKAMHLWNFWLKTRIRVSWREREIGGSIVSGLHEEEERSRRNLSINTDFDQNHVVKPISFSHGAGSGMVVSGIP
jgi:hypothetical protein